MNNINYIFVKPTDIIIKEFNDNQYESVVEDFKIYATDNNVYLKESNSANCLEMCIPIEKFNKLIEMYNEIKEHKQLKKERPIV